MQPITSTYRLQLRPDALTLDGARELAGYLQELGVSHLYLSPVSTAVDGSTHGYDVTDPTTVSEALGGRAALVALVAELRGRDMGVVVDLVPNHVGVGHPQQNRWWWDVLRRGRDSAYAGYFDIDWAQGRFAVPVLGDDGESALWLDRGGPEPMLAYHDHRYPLAPGTENVGVGATGAVGVGATGAVGVGATGAVGDDVAEVHRRQAYELVHWRSGRVGYRRFFTVDSLAALRQEDPVVFTVTHREPASWFAEGLVDGVRVDHPDGLTDPAGYLARLRGLLGPERWLVIEKILTPGEHLDPALPVDGTTGYDALAEFGGVFLDLAGAATLGELHRERTGTSGDAAWLATAEREAKIEVLRGGLAPEVRRLVETVRTDAGVVVDTGVLTDAVIETVTRIPTYRTDYGPGAGSLAAAVGDVADARPDLAEPLTVIVRAVLARGEAAARLQQVCGAATAKAVEDRLFYRTARLISLQEVGGDPGRFGVTVAQFHLMQTERARHWPAAMTTLSTHDTKRGEDVRARIGVLSQAPDLWARSVREWEHLAPSPDPVTGLLLWQTMFGVWPGTGAPTSTLRRRLHDYATKAVREAAVHTDWAAVDEAYEARVHDWIDTVLSGPVSRSMSAVVRRLSTHGRIVSVGQKLLQLAGPGIPDVYQGTELWEDSLVDPDNRRLVGFDVRRRLLDRLDPATSVDEATKMLCVREALRLRRERPSCFVGGCYTPVFADGPAADHLVGFLRGDEVIAVSARLTVRLFEHGWDETVLPLPPGTWTDRLSGRSFHGKVDLATLFARRTIALLTRDRPASYH
ncbi:malto-oligosyltrehalose synthase [Rhodococcus olei]|uniref:Malto-oligosyltrehalose synthase n=1 Tax=Rhodococcus olei TaxID=2161675 RepID=A0ABP8P364_9NOCA